MAAIVMDGKALAAKVKERVRRQVEQLDIKPGLAVVLVGDDPASRVYVDVYKRQVLACDNGLTASRMGDCQITLAKLGQYYAPAGISLFFQGREGIFGLTPAPLYQKGEYSWEFNSAGAAWTFTWEGLEMCIRDSSPKRPAQPAETPGYGTGGALWSI